MSTFLLPSSKTFGDCFSSKVKTHDFEVIRQKMTYDENIFAAFSFNFAFLYKKKVSFRESVCVVVCLVCPGCTPGGIKRV